MEEIKKKMIIKWLNRLNHSNIAVSTYFKKNKVPFSRSQYFIYKKQFEKHGGAGICDKRKSGGNRVLTKRAEAFIVGCLKSESQVELKWLRNAVQDECQCKISASGISRAIQRIYPDYKNSLGRRPKINKESAVEVNSLGGFELIIALAYHLGWPQKVSKVISKAIKNVKRSQQFEENRSDFKGRSKSGQFTRRYNQRKDVRINRFRSVSEKRINKNWQSMDIMKASSEIIIRKSLAILSLPVISMNSNIRSVDTALGQHIKKFCGYNYKQGTITKYLNELKYLGLSTELLQELTQFWLQLWGKDSTQKSKEPLICYYIDGNTKAVWSSTRIKKNKVTMLGKVMGCLEHVFIHDGWGHPIYFETYSGHAPIGEHILGLFEKIEGAILKVPGSRTKVCRTIVMDGASNSVKTLRAFASQDKYHYITPLDDNQWNERRVVKIGRPSRYRYGEATLREVVLELEDSTQKGYFIRVRAIKIDWDNGKVTILLTSLPVNIADSSEVVRSYFKRWPAQELRFKEKKAAVSLHRVVGYGRKRTTNVRVLKEQKKAACKIEQLNKELAEQIKKIGIHEKDISGLIPKERRIRAKCKVVEGERIIPSKYRDELEKIGKRIRTNEMTIRSIENKHKNQFKSLRKNQKKWIKLQGKETEYEVDVELDQIVTFHRVDRKSVV